MLLPMPPRRTDTRSVRISYQGRDFVEPVETLPRHARYDWRIHAPDDTSDPALGKDTRLPQRIKRVCEDGSFSMGRRS